MVKLRPCPFCNHGNISYRYDMESILPMEEVPVAVFCCSCGAMGPYRSDAQLAVKAWNERKGEFGEPIGAFCAKCGKEISTERYRYTTDSIHDIRSLCCEEKVTWRNPYK